MQNSNYKLTLLGIAAVYLVALLWILFSWGYTPTNDGEGYIEYALTSLANGEPYPCLATIKGEPFIWNPGIINLLELNYLFTQSVYPLLILLSVMKAATALLLALLVGDIIKEASSDIIFAERSAIICMLLYCLYPNNWGHATMLTSEVPMTFFALLALYAGFRHRHTFSMLFISGLLFCIANWFRAVAMIFLLALLLYIFFFHQRDRWRALLALPLGFALMAAVIGTDSYRRTGHFIYKSESLWWNVAADAYDGVSAAPHWAQDFSLDFHDTPMYIADAKNKTCFECSEIWRERSLKWISTHPWQYAKKLPVRLFYIYYNDIDNMSAFRTEKSKAENNYVLLPYRHLLSQANSLEGYQRLALINTLFYYLLMAFAFAGGVVLLRYRQFKIAFIPLFIILAGTFAQILIIHGETRYKAPYLPFFFILASISLALVGDKYILRHGRN
jgi:hypothetical protein